MALIECLHIIAKSIFPNIKKNNDIQSILIPHAGLKYSGLASVIPFLEVNTKNYNKIICLCTNHRTNTNIKITSNNKQSDDEQQIISNEHSYQRMKELVEYFFNEHSVIYYLIGDHRTSKALTSLSDKVLIIGNSDLWHYGVDFRNSDSSDKMSSQYNKILKENDLIKAIKESDYRTYESSYNDVVQPCGNQVIRLLLNYHKTNNIRGQVCMYHDSINSLLPSFNVLDMMKLDYKGSDHLVSYVSIIFTKSNKVTPLIKRFEQLLLLSRIKSVVEYKVTGTMNPREKIIMPSWCNINNYKNGIFVGIKDVINNATRASIGYYSTDDFVEKTLSAAESCVNDARTRWNRPILTSEISPQNSIMYYMNIFEEEDKWREWQGFEQIAKNSPGKDRTKKKYGYQYSYNKDGFFFKSTYLPGVWREHRAMWPTFIKMINDLIRKALSNTKSDDELKEFRDNGTYKTYKTTYVEEPIIDKLLCSD